MTEPTVPPPASPTAEAFRQGYEPNVEYGYQCLTCNDEWYAPSAAHAENGARIHNEKHANESFSAATDRPPSRSVVSRKGDSRP